MQTSDIIAKAVDELMIRGWVQGTKGWIIDNHGLESNQPVCIEGALQAAMGIVKFGDGSMEDFYDCPAYVAVHRYIVHTGFDNGFHTPFIWNDKVAQSADDVIDLLRTVSKIEAEKEAANAANTAQQ